MADDPRLDPRQRPLLKMMEGTGADDVLEMPLKNNRNPCRTNGKSSTNANFQ